LMAFTACLYSLDLAAPLESPPPAEKADGLAHKQTTAAIIVALLNIIALFVLGHTDSIRSVTP
jgi:hypothetical protein